jgi:hypothetical protein
MDKSKFTLQVVNEYLGVFGLDNISSLNDLPKIETKLFKKEELVPSLTAIVDKHVESLKTLYGTTEIGYYNRHRLKNYEFILFKKILHNNGFKLKIFRKLEYKGKDQYLRVSYYTI